MEESCLIHAELQEEKTTCVHNLQATNEHTLCESLQVRLCGPALQQGQHH